VVAPILTARSFNFVSGQSGAGILFGD